MSEKLQKNKNKLKDVQLTLVEVKSHQEIFTFKTLESIFPLFFPKKWLQLNDDLLNSWRFT